LPAARSVVTRTYRVQRRALRLRALGLRHLPATRRPGRARWIVTRTEAASLSLKRKLSGRPRSTRAGRALSSEITGARTSRTVTVWVALP
jgi:hypothetical protein